MAVILRMLVVKRLYAYSYEDTERHVSDSLRLRQFCRVYLNAVPDDTTLIRWANLIQPKTLEKFNQRITQLALERQVTGGRKLRTDGTVVESNIHPPSDGRLLADSVRALARSVVRGRSLLQVPSRKSRKSLRISHRLPKGSRARSAKPCTVSKKRHTQPAGNNTRNYWRSPSKPWVGSPGTKAVAEAISTKCQATG